MQQQKSITPEANKSNLFRNILIVNFIIIILFLTVVSLLPKMFLFVLLELYLLFLAGQGILLILSSIYFFITKKIKYAALFLIFGLVFVAFAFFGLTFLSSYRHNSNPSNLPEKPVIYLYPTEKTNVKVKLDFHGRITADYPTYDKITGGWDVDAYPDGHIINKTDNQEYSYLFWEGISDSNNWNITDGFVVKGEDTKDFLQQTLSKIGLTPKEYNEFIVYWYPRMKNNKYNLIHFAGEEYTKNAVLDINPKPDSMLRVFMVFKPLDKKIDISPQDIKPFNRTGFAVVEWGGEEQK